MAISFLAQAAEEAAQAFPTTVQQVTGVAPLDNVIGLLQAFGFFRVVLPFLLVFALFYGVLLKTAVLGEPDKPWVKSVTAIISLAAAFFVIGYTPVVNALVVFIPQAAFLLVIALVVLMVFAFFGFKTESVLGETKPWTWALVIPVVLIVIAMIGAAVGKDIPVLSGLTQFLIGQGAPFELTPDTQALLLGLGLIIGLPLVIVWLVLKSSNTSE